MDETKEMEVENLKKDKETVQTTLSEVEQTLKFQLQKEKQSKHEELEKLMKEKVRINKLIKFYHI